MFVLLDRDRAREAVYGSRKSIFLHAYPGCDVSGRVIGQRAGLCEGVTEGLLRPQSTRIDRRQHWLAGERVIVGDYGVDLAAGVGPSDGLAGAHGDRFRLEALDVVDADAGSPHCPCNWSSCRRRGPADNNAERTADKA